MKLLVTGATGKVGQNFLGALLSDVRFADASVIALCNNRLVEETDRVQAVRGSIADSTAVAAALAGVTHVVHLAAVKESPDMAIDVSVKGMFVLLEAFRQSPTARQFILVSGDCAVGHIFQAYDAPVTELSPRRAYKGCYALTKVIEEVMLEQYQIQYGVNGCILRAPWIMEKDDFKAALDFGPGQFGGPAWDDLVPADRLQTYRAGGYVPLMLDALGRPLRRNFVHVDDLVGALLAVIDTEAARGQLFNISMNEPVDYGLVAARLAASHGLKPAEIETGFHSNWLDNSKARMLLQWAPEVDVEAMLDRAWNYERGENDPRKIWYPG